MTRAPVIAILLVSLSVGAAEPPSPRIAVTLRDTGYMLGDLLDEHVRITLPASMRITEDSLPAPGRVAPWLEVRSAKLGARDASGAQSLVVTYQIFAESEQAARVPLPEIKLEARDGANAVPLLVPAQSFLLSPGLPSPLVDSDRELVPSPDPAPLSERGAIVGALAALALAALASAFLLWRYDRLPFLPFAPGPLAVFWRRWRARRDAKLDEHDATLLMREWHAALNRCAGETLYPSTLDRLFDRAPFLAPLRERIEALFAASWNAFYAPRAHALPPSVGVLALAREAADRERGVPC
jgi:mxaA protein